MSVLVGVVSKNRRSILPKAIDSALAQKWEKLSVHVFDDNSSDDTANLKGVYKTVSWEFSKTNKGYLFARNKFMQEPQFDYFCSLDDDSWFLDSTSLEAAIMYLDDHSDVAAIAFDILSPDKPLPSAIAEPIETNIFIGCGHVLRLSAVKEVGYYDVNPSFYGGEEQDLAIKLMDRGHRIIFMPGIHVWHDKTVVARNLKLQHRSGVCNDFVFTYRRSPILYLIPALGWKLFSHLRFAFRFKSEKLVEPCLKGIGDFFILLIQGRIARKPVKNATYSKFRGLNYLNQNNEY